MGKAKSEEMSGSGGARLTERAAGVAWWFADLGEYE